jgi:hypothetical protein
MAGSEDTRWPWSRSRKWPTKPRATQAMRIGQRELVWQKVVSELPRANLRYVPGFCSGMLRYPLSQTVLMTLPTRAATSKQKGGSCAG